MTFYSVEIAAGAALAMTIYMTLLNKQQRQPGFRLPFPYLYSLFKNLYAEIPRAIAEVTPSAMIPAVFRTKGTL